MSFPELDNLIDTVVLNQVQDQPPMVQLASMDEGMDSRIITGIWSVGVIVWIAIGSFVLYHFKYVRSIVLLLLYMDYLFNGQFSETFVFIFLCSMFYVKIIPFLFPGPHFLD